MTGARPAGDALGALAHFEWHPGVGVDARALMRLRLSFDQPDAAMGEAWFMGEQRRMFVELQGDLTRVPLEVAQHAIEEIISGIVCFGPRQEWTTWYHYLLAQLLPRSHESRVWGLDEFLITGFMAVYPEDVREPPYPEFQADVLQTLGRSLMDVSCWRGNEVAIGEILHRSDNNPAGVWRWWDASGDLSASLFLCLKYLPEAEVEGWFRSVLRIPAAHWRAQLVAWLVGSFDLLHGHKQWPSELDQESHPWVSWAWSHVLQPDRADADGSPQPLPSPFLSANARHVVLRVVSEECSSGAWQAWCASILGVAELAREIGDVLTRFQSLYVSSRQE